MTGCLFSPRSLLAGIQCDGLGHMCCVCDGTWKSEHSIPQPTHRYYIDSTCEYNPCIFPPCRQPATPLGGQSEGSPRCLQSEREHENGVVLTFRRTRPGGVCGSRSKQTGDRLGGVASEIPAASSLRRAMHSSAQSMDRLSSPAFTSDHTCIHTYSRAYGCSSVVAALTRI